MSEIGLTYLATAKLLVVVLIAFIYSRAGRGWRPWGIKIRRRVVIPLVLCIAWIISAVVQKEFTLPLLAAILLSWPVYYGVMCISYGSGNFRRWIMTHFLKDEEWAKVFQRHIVGGLYGGGCILVAIVSGNYPVYYLSVIMGSLVSAALGCINPIDASAEEALIAMGEFMFPLFLI